MYYVETNFWQFKFNKVKKLWKLRGDGGLFDWINMQDGFHHIQSLKLKESLSKTNYWFTQFKLGY